MMMKKEAKTKKDTKTKKHPFLEVEDLRIRLEEAEETLSAIRRGEVDGLVVSGPGGDQVFTLKGTDRSYRFFVEAMNEGALTLSFDGTILYCNDRFAEMVKTPYQQIIGDSIYRFLASPDAFEPAFQRGKAENSKTEVPLKRKDGQLVPVSLSLNPMQEDEVPGVCMVVTDLTEHMRADDALKDSEQRLRSLSSKLLSAHEEERKRIAGELHDSVASLIGAVRFSIEKMLDQVEKDEGLRAGLRDLVSMVQQVSQETRRIMSALRPSVLDDLGIVPAISWLCREYEKIYSHISVEKQIGVSEQEVPDSLRTPIFRISQEAMNNVAKHSKASHMDLSLQKTNRAIELSIRDNGQGFDLETVQKGMGLSTMIERAQLSGGSFDLESALEKGTLIRVSWPI
jgi:PAS domain S-box-containing protein